MNLKEQNGEGVMGLLGEKKREGGKGNFIVHQNKKIIF